MSGSPNRLTRGDRRELCYLLDLLTVHLQSAVESCLLPGTRKAMPEDSHNVRIDRADIRTGKAYIARFRQVGAGRYLPVTVRNPETSSPRNSRARRKSRKAKEN